MLSIWSSELYRSLCFLFCAGGGLCSRRKLVCSRPEAHRFVFVGVRVELEALLSTAFGCNLSLSLLMISLLSLSVCLGIVMFLSLFYSCLGVRIRVREPVSLSLLSGYWPEQYTSSSLCAHCPTYGDRFGLDTCP